MLVYCQVWALIYEQYNTAVRSYLVQHAYCSSVAAGNIIQPVHIVHHLIPFTWYSKPTVTLKSIRAGSLLGIKPVIQHECTASY